MQQNVPVAFTSGIHKNSHATTSCLHLWNIAITNIAQSHHYCCFVHANKDMHMLNKGAMRVYWLSHLLQMKVLGWFSARLRTFFIPQDTWNIHQPSLHNSSTPDTVSFLSSQHPFCVQGEVLNCLLLQQCHSCRNSLSQSYNHHHYLFYQGYKTRQLLFCKHRDQVYLLQLEQVCGLDLELCWSLKRMLLICLKKAEVYRNLQFQSLLQSRVKSKTTVPFWSICSKRKELETPLVALSLQFQMYCYHFE